MMMMMMIVITCTPIGLAHACQFSLCTCIRMSSTAAIQQHFHNSVDTDDMTDNHTSEHKTVRKQIAIHLTMTNSLVTISRELSVVEWIRQPR